MAQKLGWISMALNFLLAVEIINVLGTDSGANRNHQKISATLHKKFKDKKDDHAEVIVELAYLSKDGSEKSIYNTNHSIQTLLMKLREKAENPQESRSPEMTRLVDELQREMTQELRPVLELLDRLGVEGESLWSTGQVYIPEATWEVIQEAAKIDKVIRVRPPIIIPPSKLPMKIKSDTRKKNTWNPHPMDTRCPEITCLGEGTTVGIIDTGARTTHVELRHNWSGMPFGFYDGKSRVANCTPRDDGYHGTACAGLAVGANIGVAPKAKWMVCSGGALFTEASLIKCGQFMLCPWHCGDTSVAKITKDCSKRPDVISCSWSTDALSNDFYYPLLQLWNAAGIISTFSVGNEGPTCTSGGFPAAYDIALGVGAVDNNSTLLYYSSVGPQLSRRPLTQNSTATGTCKKDLASKDPHAVLCSIVKPDLVAPGVNVNCSDAESDTSYAVHSGTSASAPEVAGIVALMKCANPYLRWNYKLAHKLLTTTADASKINPQVVTNEDNGIFEVDTNLMCNTVLSKIPCNKFPNNMFGYGVANACSAVKASRLEISDVDELGDQFDV